MTNNKTYCLRHRQGVGKESDMIDGKREVVDKIDKPENSFVAKIYTTALEFDYANPWATPIMKQWSGSGFILDGMKLVTNAHVAAGAVHMEVQLAGSSKRYVASIKHVANECDLAQLVVDDPEFWEATTAAKIGKNPDLEDEVRVIGFPMGGQSVSHSKGIVSRMEKDSYAQSGREFMSTQVDAPINPGNSGGPVINQNNEIVGVAFQGYNGSQNLGYMIPASILQHFLKQVEAVEKGFPELAIETQNIENETLRDYYKLADKQSGIAVRDIAPLSPCHGLFRKDDVLLELEGLPINGDGSVYLNPMKKIDYTHIINEKEIGDEVTFKILRHGVEMEKTIKLTNAVGQTESIIPEEHGKAPTYYVLGGQIVVQPVTENYMKATRRTYKNVDKEHPDDQMLSINRVLKCEHTVGYRGLDGGLITRVNGRDVRNMNDLIAATECNAAETHVVELKDGEIIAIPNLSLAAQSEVLEQYYIPKDRSPDLPKRKVKAAQLDESLSCASESDAAKDEMPPLLFSRGLLDFTDFLGQSSENSEEASEDTEEALEQSRRHASAIPQGVRPH